MRHSAEDVLVAGLRLRFGRVVVGTRLYVPPVAVSPAAAVLLLAEDASRDGTDSLGPGLSAAADLVVIRVPAGAHSLPALRWLADHAHELGARPDRLMVAGRAVSGARAAWLHERRNDLLGLEASMRRLRSALVELREGDEPEHVIVPPALERVFSEVRAALLRGQAA
jgi:hypothetical protein